ncbi:probable E3 ubiquitin-protein ligase XERICO [Harpegnathos saltator]|uniref:probable E3 ubiquitin-protein ligase XERICO n=1 Tax=Harpegnathos saltator TaxID=610380 RepID=UPI00058F0334|nr:probable E3 ubiquitin-protein ligase XERICO [Harpegnathos saltator]
MTYPGLVLLVGVGIGLATFLYYIFAENESENDQRQQYNYEDGTNGRTPDYHDWRISPASSHSGRLNRRNLSNSSVREGDIGRSRMSKEDINNCSICQYALIGSDVIQLHPCRHNFHKDCIKKWRSYTPKAACPNCRRDIAHMT